MTHIDFFQLAIAYSSSVNAIVVMACICIRAYISKRIRNASQRD